MVQLFQISFIFTLLCKRFFVRTESMIKFHIWNGDVLFNLSSFFQPKCNKKAFQKLWIYELSEILTALDSILETRKVGWFKLQNEGFRAPSTFSEIHQLKLNTISTLQKVGM